MGQLGPQIIKEGCKHGRWKMAEGSTLVSNRSLEDSYGLKPGVEELLPGSEMNAEEAPYSKEADPNAFKLRQEAKPEANALPSMRILASLIIC